MSFSKLNIDNYSQNQIDISYLKYFNPININCAVKPNVYFTMKNTIKKIITGIIT